MLKTNYILVAILVLLLIYLLFVDDNALEFLDPTTPILSGDAGPVGTVSTGPGIPTPITSTQPYVGPAYTGTPTTMPTQQTAFTGSAVGTQNIVATGPDYSRPVTIGQTQSSYIGAGTFGAPSLAGPSGRVITDNGTYATPGSSIQLGTLPYEQTITTTPNGTLISPAKNLLDARIYMRAKDSRINNHCNIVENALRTSLDQENINKNTVADVWNGGQNMADLCGPYKGY